MPLAAETRPLIQVTLPEPFAPDWEAIDGITINGPTLTIDPRRYFFRYENPSWILADWDGVRAHLLPQAETAGTAVEQLALEYVRDHGRQTTDPAEVLTTAHRVYAYLFREQRLEEPGLADLTATDLRALREAATLMALNRVELNGHISNVGPAWMLPAAIQRVYQLDAQGAQCIDELYHGTWFNEYRRRESVLAHAALGGRLVHGCQSAANMSGGAVVEFGTDMTRFRAELGEFRREWIDRILS